MKTKRCLAVCGMLLAAPSLYAGAYKCKAPDGSVVYSDTQCGSGAQYVKTDPDYKKQPEPEKPMKAREATPEEIAECLRWVKAVSLYKDPDSAKIEGTPVVGYYAVRPTTLYMNVNAKNSYGGYAGAKIKTCTINEKGEIRAAAGEN